MTMRSCYCGEVTEDLLDKEVDVCGWVHRVRDLGGLIFFDLRDRAGRVQVIVDPENGALTKIAKDLHNEYVLSVRGKVRLRPEGISNKELATGKIEIVALDIKVLNTAEPLPFQIADFQANTNEDLLLRYRYLDLRRAEVARCFWLRSKIVHAIHKFFQANGFIEVETPMLTKSTPEGARDYLVPSRVHKGNFYALPQSPQIFKQLLMVAGFDRYYQIARCFRDEDLRADRQPEFTQLDVEMSFVEEQDVRNLIENMLRQLFAEILQVQLPAPFPVLTYAKAMELYGSDKPDLRIPFAITEINDLVKESAFKVFADAASVDDGRVAALKIPGGTKLSRRELDDYTAFVLTHGLKGLGYLKINDLAAGATGLQSSLSKFLTPETLAAIVARSDGQTGDLIFFGAGADGALVSKALGALRLKVADDLKLIDKNSWQPLWVIDFPLFEKAADGSLTSAHHPFTSPVTNDPRELLAAPAKSLAKAYDMVLNGTELGGGSIRIHNAAMQKAIFKVLGFSEAEAENKFGHLLNAFKYGCPPHGGVAFGIDRIAMLMAGGSSLRDVIAFPKTQQATCLLTDAPSQVATAQLIELGVEVVESGK